MRSPLRRIVIAATTVGACLGFVPMASADAPVTQGWWSAVSVGPLGVPAPDVPDDGMLVQGPAASPSAYAALSFEVPEGDTADQVLLRTVPDSASTGAELRLCPLVSTPFDPAQGGPISDAPEFDCTQEVTAEPDEFSGTYTFDVSSLPADPTLAVAVLPSGPVDRVVLSAADTMTLTTSGPTPDTPVTTPTDGPPVDAETGASPSPGVGAAGPSSPADLRPPPAPTPAPSAGTADDIALPSPAPLVPASTPELAAATVPREANPLLALLVLLGCAAAATAWGLAGRERPDELVTVPADAAA